eukprot:1045369_1
MTERIILEIYLLVIISQFAHGCDWQLQTRYSTVCTTGNYMGYSTKDECTTYCSNNGYYYFMYADYTNECACDYTCANIEDNAYYNLHWWECIQPTPYPTYPTPYPTYPTPYPTYPTPRPTPRPTPNGSTTSAPTTDPAEGIILA